MLLQYSKSLIYVAKKLIKNFLSEKMSRHHVEKMILKSNEEIIFRNLESADAEKYINFSEIIASETTHTLHYPNQQISVEAVNDRLKMSINSPWQIELGGFHNDILVSHLSLYKPKPHHPYEKHVGEFGIKIIKDFCSIGIGSAMVLIMENIAKQMNIKRIQAKVRTSNHIGVNFYRKHQYEIEGVRKQAAFINGLYENEFYIAKILN